MNEILLKTLYEQILTYSDYQCSEIARDLNGDIRYKYEYYKYDNDIFVEIQFRAIDGYYYINNIEFKSGNEHKKERISEVYA